MNLFLKLKNKSKPIYILNEGKKQVTDYEKMLT